MCRPNRVTERDARPSVVSPAWASSVTIPCSPTPLFLTGRQEFRQYIGSELLLTVKTRVASCNGKIILSVTSLRNVRFMVGPLSELAPHLARRLFV
jgi:hypothetical protein